MRWPQISTATSDPLDSDAALHGSRQTYCSIRRDEDKAIKVLDRTNGWHSAGLGRRAIISSNRAAGISATAQRPQVGQPRNSLAQLLAAGAQLPVRSHFRTAMQHNNPDTAMQHNNHDTLPSTWLVICASEAPMSSTKAACKIILKVETHQEAQTIITRTQVSVLLVQKGINVGTTSSQGSTKRSVGLNCKRRRHMLSCQVQ